MTAFLKIKLLVSIFLSDKVSEFRQTVRQVPSWIQTIAFPPLYDSWPIAGEGEYKYQSGIHANAKQVTIAITRPLAPHL